MNILINIELKILTLFKKLFQLEIEGKKNTSEYQNILTDLKKKIKQEEEILKTPEINNITEEKYNQIIEKASIIDENIGIRIMARLTGILVKNISEEFGQTTATATDKITEEVQTNIMLFYIKFLHEYAEKEQDETFRINLLLEFYNSCYDEPRVGTLLLEDSFEIRDDYFKSCYFVADLLGENRNNTQKLIDESCVEILKENLIKDLLFNEQSLNLNNKKYNFISNSCLIKAIRTIMSEECFIAFKDALLKIMNKNNFSTHANYNLVTYLLSDETKPTQVTTVTFGKPLK